MRHVRRSRLLFLLIAIALGWLGGCGGRSGAIKTHPVHGQLLLGDQPIAGARITFHPINGPAPPEIPRYPASRTDEQGKFSLTTYKEADGAPAGSYKVVIIWPKAGRSDGSGEGEEGDRLNGRYATPEATNIEIEVRTGTNDLPPFVVQ